MTHLLSTQLKRRSLLIGAGSLAGLAIASQWPRRIEARPRFSDYPFKLGVASGDPLQDSVVLWTRLAPDPLNGGGMRPIRVPIQFRVATDPAMRRVIHRGTVLATPELGHSIRVVVGGLEPGQWYWYQFKAGRELSPIGRTRTALGPRDAEAFRFAFASCQNYQQGFYQALLHSAPTTDEVLVGGVVKRD